MADKIDKALPNVDQEVKLPEEEIVVTDEQKEAEVTPEGEKAYDENKALINAATAKNAATVRQLQQDQADRFRAQYPEYSQPKPVRSDSYNKIRRIVA